MSHGDNNKGETISFLWGRGREYFYGGGDWNMYFGPGFFFTRDAVFFCYLYTCVIQHVQ